MQKETNMKRHKELIILLYVFTLIFTTFLSISCQKSQPLEADKEVQTQKEMTTQAESSETKPEARSAQKEQSSPQAYLKEETKAELRKEPLSLTEEEKKEFKKFRGVFGQEGMSRKEALENLRILLKGGPDTIPYYQDSAFGDEKGRLEKYSEDFCTVMRQAADLKCEKCYGLILTTIKEKATPPSIRPSIRACAAETIGWYGELTEGKWHGDKRALFVLREIINDKDPEVRLQAAGSLLGLGEGDIALSALNELAKDGIHQSTLALEKLFAPEERIENSKKQIVRSHTKLWDEKGREILVKALNYSSDEVKAFAAARLVDMGERGLAEPVLLDILKRLKDMKLKNYGLTKGEYKKYGEGGKEEAYKKYNTDWRALYTAISRLGKSKNKKAIIMLKDVIANEELGTKDSLIGDEARSALKSIEN